MIEKKNRETVIRNYPPTKQNSQILVFDIESVAMLLINVNI